MQLGDVIRTVVDGVVIGTIIFNIQQAGQGITIDITDIPTEGCSGINECRIG